jgi:hypothetical protein
VSTKYWRRTLIGLAICGVSVVAFDWGLYKLVRTGSCGTNEYGVVGPPCPPETALHIMAVIASVFLALVGMGIYAMRGDGGRQARGGLGAVMWMLLWVSISGAIALAAFGPAAGDDNGAKGVAVILALVFVPIGLAPIPFMIRGQKKQEQAMWLMANGKRCYGEVVSVHDTGITINDNPHIRMVIRAEPPGEAPFDIEKRATVSRVSIPRPGDRCVVFYDPANRQGRNGITFDPVPGMPLDGRRAPSPAPMPSTTPVTTTPSTGPDYTLAYARPGEADDEDPFAKIERLGELRDKGLISQAEFDDQKRRLLGEV